MGFAAGLQAGTAMAERALNVYNQARQRREFEEIQNASTSELRDYTPSQTRQIQGLHGTDAYDVQAIPGAEGTAPTLRYTPKQGLDLQGDMPAPEGTYIDVAPQRMTQFLGQRYEGELTPERMQGLRYNAMADVVAKQDPARAMQMRQEATRMQREAEEAPLRLQGLKQQVDLGAQNLETGTLTLADKKRQEEAAKNMNSFNVAFGEANAKAQEEGRTLSPRDISDLAKAAKLSYGQENELIASQVNRTKAEVDQFRLEVEKVTQGKGFEALVDLHKNDKRFGDGMHFVPEFDKKTGGVVLARFNEATGKVEDRLSFKTKAEATAYLMEEARNPANAAIWLQNYQKGSAGIAAQEAAARKDNALAGLYNQGGAGAGKGTLKQKVADFKEVYGRDPTEAEKGVLAGLVAKDPNKPEFTPDKYTAAIKNFTDAGLSFPAARAEADMLYGRGPAAGNIDATLQKANAAKGAGLSKAPIEVQAGESRMTAPGAAVRGPLRDFMRESRRGMLGGVEYFYTDPVTNKRYTTEQYNQLLNQ